MSLSNNLYTYLQVDKNNKVISILQSTKPNNSYLLIELDNSIFRNAGNLLNSTYNNGKYSKVKKTENETHIIYRWMKFDLDYGDWFIDTQNNNPIDIEDINNIPINGQVIIPKQS